MSRLYCGPYTYLCSKEVKIEDPRKYDFFNPETNKGMFLPGGCWHAGDSGRTYDTYESLRRHETGPYRYLCGKDAKIEDPRKYEFFNEETGKGYIMPGGCWFSPSGNRAYDSLDECSRSHDDCKCTCTDDYDKAFRIQGEIPNLKSKAAKERKRDSKGHFI